jgi:hypothetical protein
MYICTDACIYHEFIYMTVGIKLITGFNIWQNVDLDKIAIAYKQKIFSPYINNFQKLKPPYWVITQSQF